MKIKKAVVIGLSVVLLVVLYLLFGSYISNVMIKTKEEARLAEITLPAESGNLEFYLDNVKSTNLKWKNAVLIQGWVFNKKAQVEKRKLYLVLKSKQNTFIYSIDKSNVPRPDVTLGMHLDGKVNSHGFELKIPSYGLKEDTCSIGIVLEDETGSYFTMSNKSLFVSNGNVTLLAATPEPRAVSNLVTLGLQKPTKTIKYFIDKIDQSNNSLTIMGWCYLDGLDAAGQKAYVLLKSNDKVAIYDVETRLRKDVTKAFSNTGLNLDSSGFLFQVPLKGLDTGNFQLGLYITRVGETGNINTDKKVNIVRPK